MTEVEMTMKLAKNLEEKIEDKALYYSEQSRPGWSVPHLHAAVFYMGELIKHEGGNERILLPAIYFHDIGYAGMLKEGYSFDDNQAVKKAHMAVGEEMSKEILSALGLFSKEEISRISYLISIHDYLSEINDYESQLVFEADSLAQIDTDRAKPNFDKENYKKFLDDFMKKRAPLFKTPTGKEYLKKLLPKTEKYRH